MTKKGVIAALICSSCCSGFPRPLAAKERRGADIVGQKTDGTRKTGELIAVKRSSILILAEPAGADALIAIADIDDLTIINKSTTLLSGGLGFLIGGGAGVLNGLIGGEGDICGYHNVKPEPMAIILGTSGGVIGGTVGLIGGALRGIDQRFRFDGKSDKEIQRIVGKLAEKARIRRVQ